MTTLQLPSRATVRPASLVDVPAVARLFTPSSASHGPSGAPGPDGVTVDREQARRALRLVLAHHALEEGQVWVAERADGTLLAAGVWLPPDAMSEPPHTRFGSLLARELSTPLPDDPVVPKALKAVSPDEPHWTAITVCAPDDTESWNGAMIAELLAPGLQAVGDGNAAVIAITPSPGHLAPLRTLGFRRPHEVRVTSGVSLWLTTRQFPGERAA